MISPLPPDSTAPHQARRYRLKIERAPIPRLRVVDASDGTEFVHWQGAVARRLLSCGLLPATLAAGVECSVCKDLVKRLAMLAASEDIKAQTALLCERKSTPVANQRQLRRRFCPLERRLRRLDVRLTCEQHTIAELLFRHAGEHLTQDEVTCLLNLQDTPVTNERTVALLSELAAMRVIQALPVSDGPTFYDIDTRPHLHIYNRERNTLHDAAVHGIIETPATTRDAFDTDTTVTIPLVPA